MSQKFINTMHNSCAQIRNQSANLEFLAEAFYTTGNIKVADRLSLIAENIRVNADLISNAYSEELGEYLELNMKAVGDVISSLLNMSDTEKP